MSGCRNVWAAAYAALFRWGCPQSLPQRCQTNGYTTSWNTMHELGGIKGLYFATACKYAQELTIRAVYASLPQSEVMDGHGGGNEAYNSEGNVPGAPSEWVEPEYTPYNRNIDLTLLEEPPSSFQECPSLVGNQATAGPHHVEPYQSSSVVAAYGSEEKPHHGIAPWFSPPHHHSAHADEAGSSSAGIASVQQYFWNEQQYRLDRHR
ncbi:hypothetical protein SeMB42_g02575 [Synchytrium endobioticum]|uniref:Uncharacterized protein n=1 Tax=Synchytrium endobioticum TaxID=286115 RepID=A0A507DH81_9FUNG|nr:hypothetical protein SeMB42_g02575 [Synchytrium endobioticum]TPX50896.1 hypothetical protein SeLEV6574_g00628 [Synchytrium endobioticum]